MKEVFIISARRTPVGGFLGSLAGFSATQLGALAIQGALEKSGLDIGAVDSVYMGNVLSAGLGQSPARQAAMFAGIPSSRDATTVNKVCASGMKATMLAAQQIQLGLEDIVVSGGMESMSNVPHYAPVRKPVKYGDMVLTDGVIKDGLWDFRCLSRKAVDTASPQFVMAVVAHQPSLLKIWHSLHDKDQEKSI